MFSGSGSWFRRGSSLGMVLLAVAALAMAVPASAQTAGPPTVPPDGAGLLPGLDPRLVGAPLEYAASARDVTALRAAQDRLAALTAEQATLRAQLTDLIVRLQALDVIQQQAAAELVAAEENLRRLSAVMYANRNAGSQAAALLASDDAMDASRMSTMGSNLEDQLVAAQKRAKIARKRASELAAKLGSDRVVVESRLVQVEQAELPAARREVEVLSTYAASTLAGASVVPLGIPLATLDAYLRAEATLAAERSGCGLRWWAIAGVGRVESNHGRYGGAQPGAGGDVTPRIVGIPLDGSPGVAAIRDSDGGLWDLDPVWDRAVGPMQFIPGTWRGSRSDGNGDGATDPNNIYDAALGAGRYLCRAGGALVNDAALVRAYLAYNHSLDYANRVLGLARGYEAIGLPSNG
jgi:membrane-bound lytic murein transglycosylase B